MADAARRHAVAPRTVQMWRDRFLAGGRQALLEQKVPGTATAETVTERRMRLENQQLKLALAEADRPAADLAEGCRTRRRGPFQDLEALRAEAGMPVSRFARLAGIPERTYWYRLAQLRAGTPGKGPWPAPAVDLIEAVAAKYAADRPAWGHRKIAALMRADGHQVSDSTVERALAAQSAAPAGVPCRRQDHGPGPPPGLPHPSYSTESGLADGLLRVRNHRRWDLAAVRDHRLRRQVLSGRHRHPDQPGLRRPRLPPGRHPDRLRTTGPGRSTSRPRHHRHH